MIKRLVLFICLATLLSGCSKGNKENDIPVQTVGQQQTTIQQGNGQTPPAIQNQQPVYPTEQETTEAMQPSPDMYEQPRSNSYNNGNSLGGMNFSNMPTVKRREESTAATYSEPETTTEAPVQPETNPLGSSSEFKTVDTTTEAETTTVAETVPETTEAIDQNSQKFFDQNIEEVPANERTGQAQTVTGSYSIKSDVLYLNRENAAFRRVIDVPEVIGFSKDAYNNYIINPDLFTDNQLKLPKFSKYGYKIPYQYWYNDEQKLLNPLPTAYVLYRDMFYFANEPVVDPYKVEQEDTTKVVSDAPYGYTEASSETKSSSDSSGISALGIYPDSKTEMKFTDHAREIYNRLKDDDKKSYARRSQDYELDVKEKEFAESVGLGGYYEDKIGPGYQGVSGAGQKVYYYTEPSTGTRYELSLLQMKELLGSGKWREQNGGNK